MEKLISNPEIIYCDGGYYDTDTPLDSLQNISGQNASIIKKIYDATEVSRPNISAISQDELFTSEVNNFENLINQNYKMCAPSVAMSLNNCVIYDNIMYLDKDGAYQEFYYSSRSNDAPHAKHLNFENFDINRIRNIVEDDREIVYLGSVGSFNYGHFIIDDLAKIKYIAQNNNPITILMQSSGKIDSIKIDIINTFLKGKDLKFKFILPNEAVFCENLTYISPISFHPYLKNKEAISYINSQSFKCITPKNNKRIFVTRDRVMGRYLDNFNEISPILKEYDFEIIRPEKFSFKKQAELFHGAEIIVGIMGAAMCNTLFSKPNIKTLYLAPSGWIEPFYWDLAANLNHDYNVIYGERIHKHDLVHMDDFIIDRDIFADNLKKIVEC